MNPFPALGSADFYPTLRRTPGAVLVVFTSPGCGACRRMKSVLAEYIASGGEGVPRVFEVSVDEDVALAREYDVFHLPALFLFVDGEFHCEVQCEARTSSLSDAVRAGLEAPAQEAP